MFIQLHLTEKLVIHACTLELEFYLSFYGAFHKVLTNGVRSSLQTWQFHYVVVNQIVNFETKL